MKHGMSDNTQNVKRRVWTGASLAYVRRGAVILSHIDAFGGYCQTPGGLNSFPARRSGVEGVRRVAGVLIKRCTKRMGNTGRKAAFREEGQMTGKIPRDFAKYGE